MGNRNTCPVLVESEPNILFIKAEMVRSLLCLKYFGVAFPWAENMAEETFSAREWRGVFA